MVNNLVKLVNFPAAADLRNGTMHCHRVEYAEIAVHSVKISDLKRLFAILLLAIFLFNLAGYQLLYHYFMHRSDEQLVKQLDQNQYNEDDLIEIKIPLNLPYISSWSDYERVDGSVVLHGVYYNYVLRKVSNDTLYLKCLPNTTKTKLHTEYAKQTGKPAQAKKSNFLSEYYRPLTHYGVTAPVTSVIVKTGALVPHLPADFDATPWHPPKIHA